MFRTMEMRCVAAGFLMPLTKSTAMISGPGDPRIATEILSYGTCRDNRVLKLKADRDLRFVRLCWVLVEKTRERVEK